MVPDGRLDERSLHGGCKPRGEHTEKWGANQWSAPAPLRPRTAPPAPTAPIDSAPTAAARARTQSTARPPPLVCARNRQRAHRCRSCAQYGTIRSGTEASPPARAPHAPPPRALRPTAARTRMTTVPRGLVLASAPITRVTWRRIASAHAACAETWRVEQRFGAFVGRARGSGAGPGPSYIWSELTPSWPIVGASFVGCKAARPMDAGDGSSSESRGRDPRIDCTY